jgi:asparagine synthase (glutamine-hydrolysing)
VTAIAGVFGSQGALERIVREMHARMPRRGGGAARVVAADAGVLGVSRFEWERRDDIGGSRDLIEADGVVVAADAAIYYRDELRARLDDNGVGVHDHTAGGLVLAAYRAWGAQCLEHLEGDYAFVVWDRPQGVVLCGRDSAGLRPLFYAVVDGTLVVASSVPAVLAHPRVSDELNVRAIAGIVAGQFYSRGAATSFRDVHCLPAGSVLRWQDGRLDGPTRIATIAPDERAGRLSFADAALELRERLTRAVAERLPATGTAAVWMSGGWDSTAVFASGRRAIDQRGGSVALRPVSISYPEGDPGREDDLIKAVLGHWHAEATWLDSRAISLLDAPERAAAERDEASAMLYGPWNGALAAASRRSGARIAFDGNGGDQLFAPSQAYLADLVTSLRWGSLARELWTRRGIGWRDLARRTLVPLAPSWLLPATAWLRPSRRPLRHYLERPLPEWVRRPFVERAGVLELERSLLPRHGPGAGRREHLWMLTAPWVGRAMSGLAECALAEGVELRSPLLDQRVIALALARPWSDRVQRTETKRLLRAAMRDLLPASVLAPRPRRTGLTVGYSRYWMRQRLPAVMDRMFAAPLELEALGIVDGAALRRTAQRFRDAWLDEFSRIHLYHTVEVELWLRARRSPIPAAAAMAPTVSRDPEQVGASRRPLVFHSTSAGG